jgi:glycosyltransferase involved in cell wall biosynthesis
MVSKISIVLPLYNKASDILKCISSIQNQTIDSWELIVVDDGSTDGGADLVRSLKDPRIRILSQSNQGVSSARNRGIYAARCEWLAFIDADDEWRPPYLEVILELTRDYPQAMWLATGYQIRHPRNGVYDARLVGMPADFRRGLIIEYFKIATRSDPPVWSSAVVIRREALLAVGGFPNEVTSGEDLLTWARLAVRFPLAYDIRPMAVFHVSGHDRRADSKKLVTKELVDLVEGYPATPGLRTYLGLWCRMQAVMALRYGDSSLAVQCAMYSCRYDPRSLRNAYTLFLTCLPRPLGMSIDAGLRKLLR